MNNLIKNTRFLPGSDATPEYFTGCSYCGEGCLGGFHICRPVTTGEQRGVVAYEPFIRLCGKRKLCYGCVIRAGQAQKVNLAARFYGQQGELLEYQKAPVEEQLTDQYSRQMRCFTVPKGAQTVRLSLEFTGNIEGCRFCAPTAYFEQ